MASWHRFVPLACVLGALPATADAEGRRPRPNVIAPPIPDGPTLQLPAEALPPVLRGDTRPLSWLEDGADVVPAGANEVPWLAPAGGPASALDRVSHTTVSGDACSAASACHFDQWCQDGVFACGSTSTQVLFGAYFSGRPGPRIPTFNYLLTSVRHGWMLTCPDDNWCGRGNYEFLLDLSGAIITSGGYGDYFAGPTFYLRYNWVEPGSCLVPYHQFGVGTVYTDAHKDRGQEAIGHKIEFYLRWEAGLRYFIAPNLSLDVEGGIQHLSNAQHARRNLGANAWGGRIGLTYYFPWGGQ